MPTTNPRSIPCRAFLAAAVCLTAVAIGAIEPAQAQTVTPPDSPCDTITGIGLEIVTCTGNLSGGVDLTIGSGPYEVLNVHSLTSDITPASGVPGILFTSDGSIELNVNTGLFTISTTGDDAPALFAASTNSNVTINAFADIVTTGNFSHGIAAESDGGEIDIIAAGSIEMSGDAVGAVDGAFGIFAASISGNITIVSAADITTSGIQGVGIFAETSGLVTIVLHGDIATFGEGAAAIAASGYTGTAVLSTSDIRTSGEDAPGITVLSDGDAGVVSSGNITTTGDTSDGINVVSTNGMTAVVNSGKISATGFGSAGIYAAGYAGALVMNYGSVVGGPCCAGVMMDSASFNTLLNWGTITAGLADYAIDIMAPSNAVENFGTVTGNVVMAGVTSVFNNNTGALFNAGDDVMTDVNNAGTLAPGGIGTVETTDLDGSLTQSGSGIFAVDVGGAAADELIVSDTAQLAGKVDVNFVSLPALTSYTILEGTGGLTNNGLGLIASPALNATLQFNGNGNDLDLVFAIDFSLALGLNPNQKAIAENLDQIFRAGVGGVGPVLLGLLNVDDLTEFKAALDQLSPELYSDAEITALYSSLAFSSALLSCKVNGTDTASIIREGQCLWAGASATFLDAGTTSDQIGFSQTAGLFNAGAQIALDDVWRLGFAGGFQSSSLQTSTGAQSEGSLAQGGVSLKYNPGQLLLAGAVTGGGGWYDTTRIMSFGGFTGVAEGEQTLGVFNAAWRAAYVFGDPRLFFKPILDASLTHLELGGFTESGGNGAALSVDGGGNTVFSLAPILEAGTEWWIASGTLVRPLIRGGAVWYEGGDFALTASFAGAPAGVSPFAINTDIDEVMGLVGAGVEVISDTDAVLRLSYDGQLGSDTQIHSVGIKGSAKF